MTPAEIRAAFERSYDQVVVSHGYADHMRDYDVFVHLTADPRSGIAPEDVRYRFTHCVSASVTTALSEEIWRRSLDDRLIDPSYDGEPTGFVWGVRWHNLYPGMSLIPDSAVARKWSSALGLSFHEATIETDAHRITLVFADLIVDMA